MLKIWERNRSRRCDGVTRRNFLEIGSLGVASLALPDLLRARACAASHGVPSGGKSVILFWLDGGPTHLESYDPKPDAPAEYRGPLGAISSNVPGIQLSQLLVHQARVMDKVSIVRSMHHNNGDHFAAAHWMLTGYHGSNSANREPQYPSGGSIVAKMCGSKRPSLPAYVAIPYSRTIGIRPGYNSGTYLGAAYDPFDLDSDPSSSKYAVRNLNLPSDVTVQRLDGRRNLLDNLDRLRRDVDRSGVIEGIDKFNVEALEMVTGTEAQRAFDIAAEDEKTRDRYGRNTHGQSALLARRLIEAGVRFVTIHNGGWDMHSNIQSSISRRMPDTDRAIGVLIRDLSERGMLDDTIVCVMGEFGRTPRVNTSAGRDHWGNVMSVLLGGGGLQGGQVVGASDSKGQFPTESPIAPADVWATIYRTLEMDMQARFVNHSGRPVGINNDGQPIDQLI